ncbi:MAG: hypothetical protein AAF430_24565 [Myxococcota bacterium]
MQNTHPRRASAPLVSALALLLGASLLSPGAARAGGAGGNTIPCEATQQIHFVLDDDGDGFRDPGETTACANPVVDNSGAFPVVTNGVGGTVCLPAVQAQMRGTLTVIADDDAKDSNVTTLGQNTGEVLTLLFELRHQNQVARVADSYTATNLVDLILGNWNNRITSESRIFGLQFTGALLLTPATISAQPVIEGSFDDLAIKLSQVAQDFGLVVNANDVVPLISDAARDGVRKRFIQSNPSLCGDAATSTPAGCGELEAEESGSLASIAEFRITLSFAEKVPGAPPTCS